MKTNLNTLDEPVLLTNLPNQTSPLKIHGDVEVLQDYAAELQAYDTAHPVDVVHSSPKPKTPAVEAVCAPEVPIYELPTRRERVAQYFADAKLRKFDKVWNTNLYQEKQVQRRKTAIFLMANEADLFDRGSDYYKSQLNRLAKAAIKG